MRRMTFLHCFMAIVLGTMLLSASPALAQDASGSPSGLAVIGHGKASAPAELAILQLSISNGNFGGPPAPQPAEAQRQEVVPIVQALVDAGVAEDQIAIIVGPYAAAYGSYYGPAVAILNVALETPSLALMTELVDAAAVAADQERLILGTVGAVYGLADCSAIMRDARQAAIDDARAQADTMAALLDVSLGDIIGARDVPYEQQQGYSPYPSPPIDACDELSSAVAIAGGFNLPPFDPTSEPMVAIEASVELTFAITGGGMATPAA